MATDVETVTAGSSPCATGEALACIQPRGFLLVLSPDWIVLRASENVHRFLGESHVTLIDEPLGRFVQPQALHDLRNLFSRLSSAAGPACAYRVRLTEDPHWFDLLFQSSHGRVLLEGVPSLEQGLGEAIGSVGGLIAGLAGRGTSLLENGARRMRALTGFDRVRVCIGDEQAESARGAFAADGPLSGRPFDTRVVEDVDADAVPVFPRRAYHRSVEQAIFRAPSSAECDLLRAHGVAATMSVPIRRGEETIGWFHCDHRKKRSSDLETHAAALLFGQMFAMQLEIARLKSSPPGGGVGPKG